MRRVSLHPSSFALPPWPRPRSNGRRHMPRQNRLRPALRSRRKICRRAMGEEGGASFDHLVGAGEQRWWNFEAERLGGRQIDNEIKPGRLLDWNVAWLRTAQNLVDIIGCAPVQIGKIWSVGHQTSALDELPATMQCR